MITKRARAEADYYLSLTPSLRIVRTSVNCLCLWEPGATEADYEEWFLHDSKGVPFRDGSARSTQNPIQLAKRFYGIYVDAARDMYNEMGMFSLLALFRDRRPLRFLGEAIGLVRIQEDLVESFFHEGLEGYTWPGAEKLLSVGAPIELLVGAFGEETVRGWVSTCITYYLSRPEGYISW